jgi:endoglucanase
MDRRFMRLVGVGVVLALSLATQPSQGKVKRPTVVRVGGPSDLSETAVAIVASDVTLDGQPFTVRDAATDAVVGTGTLARATGSPKPWKRAYIAGLGDLPAGTYEVEAAGVVSTPWTISEGGSRPALLKALEFFAANRDGNEPSSIHAASHLNDAVIHPAATVRPGDEIDMTGGWMDAGDMIHFTQTTAFSASLLQAAARLDPASAAALNAEADVGIRWLLNAHPDENTFVAQVADARDHDLGFRDPADDDASDLPGIGVRNAYTLPANQIGGDLGGKAATALAMAFRRTGNAALLEAARDWYAAGKSSNGPAPSLPDVGYPKFAGDFYNSTSSQDSLAAAAVQLFRATGEAGFLNDFVAFIQDPDSAAIGSLGVVDGFGAFAASDACGAFGETPIANAQAQDLACDLLDANAGIASERAASSAFGTPGVFTWGSTAYISSGGALAAMDARCEVAAGARDYLLGRNPWGASFLAGVGPDSPDSLHHWGFTADPGGIPQGAVVGGPAPKKQIKKQGFKVTGPFNWKGAAYDDDRDNYVTSEPAIDYVANAILLFAALARHC